MVMAINKTELLKTWGRIPPKTRFVVGLGSTFAVVMLVSSLFVSDDKRTAEEKRPVTSGSLALPGGGNDVSIEKIAAEQLSNKQEIQRLHETNDRLEKAVTEFAKTKTTPDSASQDLMHEVQSLRQDVSAMKAVPQATSKQPEPSLDDQLPPSSINSMAPVQATAADQVGSESSHLRIIGTAPTKKSDDVADERKPVVFLPAGSNFEGILMNGMDAPTSQVSQKNPVPALIKLDTDAILPNRYKYDIRECFSIVTGYGVLSTERAQLQTVSLSCVKNDGSVIETKMEGYVVGEDGKVGMRGRLVTKQGQLLAKSLLAGFLGGIGQAMAPMAVPQMNINPGQNMQFQTNTLSNIMTAGVGQGVATSANNVSQFYLNMATQMFPVVEIDASRRVTIILVRGVELNSDKKK